jgi:hypothetical protein
MKTFFGFLGIAVIIGGIILTYAIGENFGPCVLGFICGGPLVAFGFADGNHYGKK